jgi:5'-nucleotidase
VAGAAVSVDGARAAADYDVAAQAAARVASQIAKRGLPRGLLLNVNVPAGPVQGWRVTRQGQRVYRDMLVERHDPRGKPYYWIGGEAPSGEAIEGTDYWALTNGYISVTPLQLDLTAHSALPLLAEWWP